MITIWLQGALGTFMVRSVGPAAVRAAARFVPAEHLPTVQDVVDRLFNPDSARILVGGVDNVEAGEVKP
jgi:hypothetical protein